MRISKISIESFGNIKGRQFDLRPGLNVFYGPNESGKTTVMEFVRSTLVPASKKKKFYPERSKSDSGSIDTEEGGTKYTLCLDYKDRSGEVPECIANMDPELYRSIHAMGYYDLEDDRPITDREIYSKYLTIPGGEVVPAVIKTIDDKISEQVGKTSRAASDLSRCLSDIEQCQSSVAELKTKSFAYSDILGERNDLEYELSNLISYNNYARSVNAKADIVDLQKDSFDKLNALRSKRDAIRSRPLVDDAALEKHSSLESEVISKKAAFDTIDGYRKDMMKNLPADYETIRSFMARFSAVEKSYPEYRDRSSKPREYKMIRGKFNPIVAAVGALIMLIGAVPFAVGMDNPALIAAICIIAGVGIIGGHYFTRPKNHKVACDPVNERWIKDFESEVEGLIQMSGLKHMSYDADVDNIKSMSKIIADIDSNTPGWSKADSDLVIASNNLSSFLAPYGGEEGFRKGKDDYRVLLDCESTIKAVSESISAAGYDPDKPFPAIERIQLKDSEQTEVTRKIGLLDERLDSIIKDGALDQEMDRLSSLKTTRDSIIRNSAVTVLSAFIVDEACADLYTNVQPEVMRIADVYLSLMTDGLYRMDSDPRNEELSVITGNQKKTLKQCSSGTRSQILLALKLAISKQMCNGKVPMVLDDVLITFDFKRVEGACKALSQISTEMQVLLFTCSDTVLKICEDIPDVNVIKM